MQALFPKRTGPAETKHWARQAFLPSSKRQFHGSSRELPEKFQRRNCEDEVLRKVEDVNECQCLCITDLDASMEGARIDLSTDSGIC